jgi:hypothetical protein
MTILEKSIPFVFNYQAVEVELQRQCKYLFRKKMGMDVTLSLRFDVPENLETLIIQNRTLKANITLTWSDSDKTINIEFPAPFHGVFVIRSDYDTTASKRCWIPLLIDKPGKWILKKYKENEEKTEIIHRLAFPGGKYFDIPLDEKTDFKIKKTAPTIIQLDEHGIELAFNKQKTKLRNDYIHDTQSLIENTADYVDAQDLIHQRLQTYDNYVIERFLSKIINCFISVFKNERSQSIFDEIITKVTPKEKEEFWEGLKERERVIGWQIFPVDYLISIGRLELFSPLNNIDAVSQLTSLKRYPYSKNLPAIYHQNHPSFKNIFCPIETPESSDVGITVHLAKGVTTDIWGDMYPDKQCDTYLGYASALVPFYQHNDAVRVMMGAKNLRQAVPLVGSEPPIIQTGNEQDIIDLINPLHNSGIVPEHFGKYEPGRMLLVAYMPWYGYNFEDAIVANENLVTDGQMNWHYEEKYSKYLLPGFEPELQCGRAKVGHKILNGEALVEFPQQENTESLVHDGYDGILTELNYIKPVSENLGGMIKWRVKYTVPLQVGSKFMARYGNKGVISKFYNPDQMPRLPDDENLPENLRGKSVDLVLNPHGVISRMNLGQLLETQYSLAMSMGFKAPPNIGTAFEQLDHSELCNFFDSKTPFDKYGRIKMQFEDGSLTTSPVTIGYEYFTVLKHIPSKKAHARRGRDNNDRYNQITGQPVGGKANKGGQRIGEMEFWALAAHQADNIIKEIVTHRSDPAWTDQSDKTQTTQAILDHLYALGFQFDNSGNVSAVSDDDIKNNINAKPITNCKTRIRENTGIFKCPKCNLELLGGESVISIATGQRSEFAKIDVQSILNHFGYENLQIEKVDFDKPDAGKKKEIEEVSIKTDKGFVQFELEIKRSGIALRFNIDGEKFIAKRRMEKVFHLSDLPFMSIRCKKHTTEYLICENAKLQTKSIPGGLYDADIFGTSSITNPELGWGLFEISDPVEHPLIKDHFIKTIPILPLKYRSVSSYLFLSKGEEHDLTNEYIKVFELNEQHKKDKIEIGILENSIARLYEKIKQRTFGKSGKSKFGLLRRHGLGRRLDYSGRLVIVPDPSLGWDEVSVPINVLSVLYGDQISETLEDESLKNYFIKCRDISYQIDNENVVLDAINNYLSNTNSRVLLNRAPSLHKYNILSFKPLPHKIEEGMVLKLNPIVFKAFGADADGDEMSIHALLDDESNIEAKKLSPIHKSNILSAASGEPILDFDQDFVLGNFLINGEKKSDGITRIEQLINDEEKYHSIILSEMRKSFDRVTRDGVSFSFLELLNCRITENEINNLVSTDASKLNSKLEDAVKIKLEEIVSDKSNPGYYFAAMALSGARGKKQTRQVLAARGLLSPGLVGFEPDDNQFIIPESLVDGMTPESSYLSTFNSRSSMIDKNIGTFKAGYLMRKLVLAMWPYHIVVANCGAESILDCNSLPDYKICTHCYGIEVTDNFPAGLIAAQSIGERCTQLTMSSFHSGEKGVTLGDVEIILSELPKDFNQFYEKLHGIPALENIRKEHFRMLWLVIKSSSDETLNSAIKQSYSPLSSTVGIDSFGNINGYLKHNSEGLAKNNPVEKLILSNCTENSNG